LPAGPAEVATGAGGMTGGTGTVTLPAQTEVTIFATMHNVTFNLDGGEGAVPTSIAVVHNETVALALMPNAEQFTKFGYENTGKWYTVVGEVYTEFVFGTTQVTADTVLYLRWVAVGRVVVNFDLNGGEGATPLDITLDFNETIALSLKPDALLITRIGFTHDNKWYTRVGNVYTEFVFGVTPVTANTTLFLKWTINEYTILFSLNGGTGTTPNAITGVEHGSTVATLPSTSGFTRAGFTNTGSWYTIENGVYTQFVAGATAVTANTILYLRWQAVNTFALTFDLNGGTGTLPTSVVGLLAGDTVFTRPSTSQFVKAGYANTGTWYTFDGTVYTEFVFGTTTISGDTTLYLQWNAVPAGQVAVNFNLNGGVGNQPATVFVTEGATVTLPNAAAFSRVGYTNSNNWYTTEGTLFAAGTPVTANMTLYLRWTLNEYTVSFNLNGGGGTAPSAIANVGHGSVIATLPSTGFTRAGFTNTGNWYTRNGDVYTRFDAGVTQVTANTTLWLRWMPVNTFRVVFDLSGGEGTLPTDITGLLAGSTVNSWNRPDTGLFTKLGYVNTGRWYTFDGANYAEFMFGVTAITGNTTLFLQWTPIAANELAVRFNLNGGVGSVPETRTVIAGATVADLPNASAFSRAGFVNSNNWYTRNGNVYTLFEADVTAVEAQPTELWLQWTPQAITITNPSAVLTQGMFGAGYNAAILTQIANNVGGTVNFAVVSGALPNGLSLNAATGAITGAPTGVGNFNFAIRATVAESGMFADMNFSIEVTRANQVAPAAISADDAVVTAVTVTLPENALMEFRLNDGAWQTSNVFEGLQRGTEYTFYQRLAATATHSASAASEGITITTLNPIDTIVLPPALPGDGAGGTTPPGTVLAPDLFDNIAAGDELPLLNSPEGWEFVGWQDVNGNWVTNFDPNTPGLRPVWRPTFRPSANLTWLWAVLGAFGGIVLLVILIMVLRSQTQNKERDRWAKEKAERARKLREMKDKNRR
jgi:hypothetical protein